MLGDWKRDCTSRTLVDSALPGSQYFASFFSAPMSLLDSGAMITSTTTQKPTTTHLVQLPAGISASLPILFIDSPPGSSGGQRRSSGMSSPMPAIRLVPSGTELSTAMTRASGNCAMSLTWRTWSGPAASNRHRHRCSSGA